MPATATVGRTSTTTKGADQVDGGGGLITMINSRPADDASRQHVLDVLAIDATFVGVVETLGLAPEIDRGARLSVAVVDEAGGPTIRVRSST